MGAALATGHAGLRGGLCLHRLPAIQRPAAKRHSGHVWAGGPRVSRGAQCVGRGLRADARALSLCVFAGPHRVVRARQPSDGGRTLAGRAVVAPHSAGCFAAGASCHCCGHGLGLDGNPGRLWCVELLWHSNLHGRHLQSVAGDGQPHRRRTTGHLAARGGGGHVGGRATRAVAPAFCKRAC